MTTQTHGVRAKARDTGGFRTWNEEESAQFEAVHPIGTKARLAFGLLLYTAQMRADVIRMGRQHIRDGFIAVRQQKTGRSLQIQVQPDLQEILAAHPAQNLTFLTTVGAKPFSAQGFTAWFRSMVREAGLPPGHIGSRAKKGLVPPGRRGWLLGKSDCDGYRPCYAERGRAVHESGRSKALGSGHDGNHRVKAQNGI